MGRNWKKWVKFCKNSFYITIERSVTAEGKKIRQINLDVASVFHINVILHASTPPESQKIKSRVLGVQATVVPSVQVTGALVAYARP